MKWEELREEEFEGAIEKSGGLCVIPIGCIEKHGQHLPVGVDYINIMHRVEKAAELEDVVIFPLGGWAGDVCSSHSMKTPGEKRKRGYIGINPKTLLTIYTELCDEIARNGFRKILFVNGHGGNTAMLDFFVRGINYEKKDYAVMWMPGGLNGGAKIFCEAVKERRDKDFTYITDEDIKVLERFAETGYGGGHAHFEETAILMSHRPDLVAEDRYEAESGLSTGRATYLSKMGVNFGLGWINNFPNAYNGYPSHGCSQTIGQALTQMCAERLANVFKVLKEDEDCVRMAKGLPKE